MSNIEIEIDHFERVGKIGSPLYINITNCNIINELPVYLTVYFIE